MTDDTFSYMASSFEMSEDIHVAYEHARSQVAELIRADEAKTLAYHIEQLIDGFSYGVVMPALLIIITKALHTETPFVRFCYAAIIADLLAPQEKNNG
jgi:prolipoprotein diacylglyceryltransferase